LHIDPVMFCPDQNQIMPGITPVSVPGPPGPPVSSGLTDEELREAFKTQREILDHVKGKDEPWRPES
jgi:hypothetical protein